MARMVVFACVLAGGSLTVAACGGHEARQPAHPKAAPVEATAWSKRDTAAQLWPASAQHVALVLTAGPTPQEHLLWVLEGPRKVDAVYRVLDAETADAVKDITINVFRPTVQPPLVLMIPGGGGIFHGPPPPPPPQPIGIPSEVVERVVDFVGQSEAAAKVFDQAPAAATGAEH